MGEGGDGENGSGEVEEGCECVRVVDCGERCSWNGNVGVVGCEERYLW